jgi:hypothetical protein
LSEGKNRKASRALSPFPDPGYSGFGFVIRPYRPASRISGRSVPGGIGGVSRESGTPADNRVIRTGEEQMIAKTVCSVLGFGLKKGN